MPTLKQLLHEPRWQPFWRWILLVLAAISAFFAFSTAGPPLPATVNDKVNHLAAFAAMGAAAALCRPAGRRHAATAWTALLGYGAFIEIVQSALPTRHANLADLLADGLGAAAGLLLSSALRRLWRPGPERAAG